MIRRRLGFAEERGDLLRVVGEGVLAAAAAALIGGLISVQASAVQPSKPPAADGDPEITAVTFIHGLPGHADDLRAHLLSLAGPTRAEPGCLAYDLYQSPDAPHEFVRLEAWRSREDLETHKRSPHLRASFEKRQREGWTTQITVWERVPEDRAGASSGRMEATR